VELDGQRRRVVMDKPAPPIKVIATNRKATHDYVIHDRLEAGISLVGSEVKSLRNARVVIQDGWVEFRKGQALLHGVQIQEYAQANRWGHELERVRKLLLHAHEIDKLAIKTQQRGYTLIPLGMYFKGHRVKVELALVTHKKQHDKRETKKLADDKREMDRAIKRARG
jgi:SsrA-binding protein